MQMMSVVLPDLGAGFVLSLEIFVVTLVGAVPVHLDISHAGFSQD